MPKDRTGVIPRLIGEPREHFAYTKDECLYSRAMCCAHSGQFYEQLARRVLGGDYTASEWNGSDPRPDVEVMERALAVEVKGAGKLHYFKVDMGQLKRYNSLVKAGFPYDKCWYFFFWHNVSPMVGRTVNTVNKLLAQTTTKAVVMDIAAVNALKGLPEFPVRDYRSINWPHLLAVRKKPLWNYVANGLVDRCSDEFRIVYGRVKLVYLQRPVSFELRGILLLSDSMWLKNRLRKRTDSSLKFTAQNVLGELGF